MPDILEQFVQQGLDSPVLREEITQGAEDELAARKYSDEAALQVLHQDLQTGEADKTLLDYTHMWSVCDELYQTPWNNSYFYSPAKANVPDYTLSNILDVVVTKQHTAMFFEETPFMLLPNPKLNQNIMWAKEAVMSTQLREMEFDIECEKGFFQNAHLGTQIYKYGWMDSTKKVPVYKAKGEKQKFATPLGPKEVDTPESDEFELTYEDKDVHRPWLKWRDLRYLVVSPTWNVPDIRQARWLIDTEYVTFDDLDELRDTPGYDIPSRESLEALFFPPLVMQAEGGDVTETRLDNMRAWLAHAEGRETNDSADPFAKKLRLLERWDGNKVTVALKNSHGYLLIRNETHDFGAVPYLSSVWRPIPSCGYGQGLGQLVGPDQQVAKGTRCAYLDILAFIAKPSYVRQKPLNTITQDIKIDLGTIISVEGPVNEAFKLLEQPRVDPSLVAAIEAAKSSAANTSGASEITGQGGTTGAGRGTGMRSGSGAQLVGQAQAGRLDGPMERFIRQVFVPWLYIMDEMNSKRLPARALREILDDDAVHDYSEFDHIAWRAAQVNYQVLAGAHLGPRKAMAESMPLLMQMVSSPPMMQAAQEAGMKFNFNTFIKEYTRLSGFAYEQDFWVPMSDQEKQQSAANMPAAVQQMRGQQASQMQAQKDQGKQQNTADQSLGRAAEKATQLIFEHQLQAGENEGAIDNG